MTNATESTTSEASGALPAVTWEQQFEVERFLFREARLADESRYDEWLALFADQVTYWVPKGKADYDPDTQISYINDNRNRLQTRVKQLATGVHYAQTPPSPMRRVLSNIEIIETTNEAVTVSSNFVLYEHSIQASNDLRVWAGNNLHGLLRTADGLRIRSKTVELVNSHRSLPTMAFLL